MGGQISLRFCRFENNLLPCGWIAGCWQMQMDINKLLADHYSKEELDRICIPPKPKLESLVDLIAKAKKAKTGK